ncbi:MULTISPECIES: CPBP family intramembrane glutamic endopeptidase [Chryseobacterium]|uniref:Membrane protease YdiL (CAAX protease family) n=1 Tax=Chryseobacterium geocarposphaerae TaxID=1416776 RepID=A0ABU1LF50_9FLAO|nr:MULTISPECIES: type II CAAX endopeptidase family protein [Chryseobacterium]MDR6405230.1 membrane protease YdiL (CAAX protease family) [Chryseobacterium geocarposphaerae]MDR6697389.1 membrane protease YdiL (CAAX protease family) [Chryseobacterium ginsenosidimutans]
MDWKVLLNNKWIALLLLAITFALIYNPFTKFPYTFCIIIAVILLFTYLQDKNLKSLNFKKIGFSEIKIIIICYLTLELSMDFIFQPLVSRIFNEPADYSSFKILEGNPKMYLKWLFNMWISAAIGEELLFRGFAFSQLKRVFGEKKILLVVLSAILFSLPHLYQGISGLVMTFLFGLTFGFIYLKFKNIWINIIIHGLIDTVFLTLSYYGLTDFYSGFNIIF